VREEIVKDFDLSEFNLFDSLSSLCDISLRFSENKQGWGSNWLRLIKSITEKEFGGVLLHLGSKHWQDY
jgi:hypothetical protein